MSVAPHAGAGGLTNSKLAQANSGTGDVLSGKTFYSGDKNLKTGTLSLSGSAGDGDVLSGKTYYNNDAKAKRTGNMANRGAWGTTISPGGSVTIPPGYHNGGGVVYANTSGVKNIRYASVTQQASRGHFIYTIPSGTLIGITNLGMPNWASERFGEGCSVWMDGNTIHVQTGSVDGYITMTVTYAYY